MLITTVYTKDGLVGSIYRISTSFTKRGIAQLFRRTELSVPLLEQHPILLAANVSLDPPARSPDQNQSQTFSCLCRSVFSGDYALEYTATRSFRTWNGGTRSRKSGGTWCWLDITFHWACVKDCWVRVELSCLACRPSLSSMDRHRCTSANRDSMNQSMNLFLLDNHNNSQIKYFMDC